MKRTTHIRENFMDDLEPENPADKSAKPVSEKILRATVRAKDWEQDEKLQHLKKNVTEEDWELAVKLTPVHDSRQGDFYNWMRNPECFDDISTCVHGGSAPAAAGYWCRFASSGRPLCMWANYKFQDIRIASGLAAYLFFVYSDLDKGFK